MTEAVVNIKKMTTKQALQTGVVMLGLIGLGGCSLASLPKGLSAIEKQTVAELDTRNYIPRSDDERAAVLTQDLFAQAAFWSREFELNPADLEAATNLSSTLRRLGNPSQSLVIAGQTRALYPRDAALMVEMAASHISLSQPKEAIELLDQALVKNMSSGRAWSLKGAALDQLEMYDQARQHYTKALSYAPADPSILANVGLSYALEGDPKTAEVWLRRAANMPGASANVRQNLALVLELQGNTQEAAKWNNWDQKNSAQNAMPNPLPTPSNTGVNRAPAKAQYKTPTMNMPTARPAQQGTRLKQIGSNMTGAKTASDAARLAYQNHGQASSQTGGTQKPMATNPYAPPQNNAKTQQASAEAILDQISHKNTTKRTIAQHHNAHYQARLNAKQQQMARSQTANQYAPQAAQNRPQMTQNYPQATQNQMYNTAQPNPAYQQNPRTPSPQVAYGQYPATQNPAMQQAPAAYQYGMTANPYMANPYANTAPAHQTVDNTRSPARSRR